MSEDIESRPSTSATAKSALAGGPAIPRSRWRAVLLVIGIFVIAGFVLSLVPLNRYRAALAAAIGHAVGRDVSIGQVTLSFVPQPGFDISDLVIQDDSRYSAEPVLRAASVHATLRLSSFWRGKPEIASLSMKGASLNLVRAADGSWNIERLLLLAQQIPSAPTAKKQPEARPRFPYIEATESRINFKSGAEKKVLALNDAEFALWLASENRWNLRLEARPIRSDKNLSDTGKITISGSFDRARTIAETPFHIRVSLDQAQLGEWSRLIYGYDRGWHADIELTAEVQGTPAQFSARTELALSSLRRYDIARADNLDLNLRCDSQYQKLLPEHPDALAGQLALQCALPLGRGSLNAQGTIASLTSNPVVDLNFIANQVPLSALAFALVHAKSTLPNDFSAAGVMNGNASFARNGTLNTKPVWKGVISFEHTVLRSKYLQPELALGNFNLSLDHAVTIPAPTLHTRRSALRLLSQASDDSVVNIVPFDLDLGGNSESQITGKITPTGYLLRVQGPASIRRLLQLARTVGVNAGGYELNGHTYSDLALYGDWKNFAPAQLQGHAELSATVLPLKGISEPLSVSAASLSFDSSQIQIENLEAAFKKTKLALRGTIAAQRNCPDRLLCNFRFALETPDLDSDSIARLLTPSRNISLPFLSFRRSTPDWLLSLTGSGTISAAHVHIKDLEAKNLSAQLVLEPNLTEIKQLDADLLGGHHQGDWTINFASGRPFLTGAGTVQQINMQLLSTAMKESWGSGTLNAQYRLTLTGSNSAELLDTASGSASFDWRNGKLLSKSSTQDVFTFIDWSGSIMLRDRVIHLQDNHVRSASGVERVSGTVDLNRESDLRFEKAKGVAFSLQGPLDSPSIIETPATAALGLHQ